MKNSEKYTNVKEILEGTGLLNVNEAPKGRGLKFKIYITPKMEEDDIESLDLSPRSLHCLKRAGIYTIGDLCEKIHSSADLKTIRNCGATSVAEIIDKLFLYNYMQLKPERRGVYLAKIVEMNVK